LGKEDLQREEPPKGRAVPALKRGKPKESGGQKKWCEKVTGERSVPAEERKKPMSEEGTKS